MQSADCTAGDVNVRFVPSPDCEWPLPPHHAAGQWGGATVGLLLYGVRFWSLLPPPCGHARQEGHLGHHQQRQQGCEVGNILDFEDDLWKGSFSQAYISDHTLTSHTPHTHTPHTLLPTLIFPSPPFSCLTSHTPHTLTSNTPSLPSLTPLPPNFPHMQCELSLHKPAVAISAV